MKLSYEDLRCLPLEIMQTTIVCKGNFEDTAVWGGAVFNSVLEMASVKNPASQLKLFAADGYAPSVSLQDARSEKSFLAFELRGEPIPVLHGFPLRAAFPGLLGAFWVKWLTRIEVY